MKYFFWIVFVFMALSGCTILPPVAENSNASPSLIGTPTSNVTPSAATPDKANERLSDLLPIQIGTAPITQVALPNDLWERIRKGFAMPDLQTDLAQDRVTWYSSRPDYLQRMSERSSKYLFYIVDEIEQRKMPTELALLPFIESAFNPQAMSSAKASGMWQFMPRTGKDFDLKQNAFRDDRRDVMASTRAALDYLQRLYGMFNDWHLALAAYNWGEGNVGKALSRNQRNGSPLSYVELNMPMETRFYVPKLQAIKNIVADPLRHNIKLPHIPNHPYFQSVPLTKDVDVTMAAKLAEISVEDFKALNPSANRPVLLSAGIPQILLPWDNAEIFQRNFETYGGRLASWTAWIAPSAMKIADAAKKIGMSEAEFRSANQIPPRMMIRAGSALLIPRSDRVIEDVSPRLADIGQLNLSPEGTTRRVVVKAGKNDTMASMAKKHKQSLDQLAQWNNMSMNTHLKPGQEIVMYASGKSKSSGKSTKASKSNKKKPKQ